MESSQTANNLIQEKQELCACKRGNRVRYYCPQESCAIHKDNIFLCDDCFNDIMEGEEPHKLLQIQKLLEPLTKKWLALIQKEEETYNQVLSQYNQFKHAIELLETGTSNPSRHISKEICDYEKFHTEFKQTASVFKEYQQSQQITKIHGLNGKYDESSKLLDSGFSIIKEIGETDFMYQNYTECIDNCKIPEKLDEKSTRDAILAMKVRSWNSQIQKASTQEAEEIAQEKLIEEVKQLKQTVKLQQTQINALISILGGLEGASQLVSKSFDSILQQKKEEQASLKIMPLDLKLSQPLPGQQTIQLAEPIFGAKPLSGIKPIEVLSLAPQPQPLFGVSKPNILTSPAIPGNPFSAPPFFGTAKKTEEKKFEYELVQQFPLEPVTHVFTQEMLDKLLDAFNKPFGNYTPKLDEHGQSKLADFITKNGWFKSIEELNAEYYNSLPKKSIFDKSKIVKCTNLTLLMRTEFVFEEPLDGVYYGQYLDGWQNGFSFAYCIDKFRDPWLYEMDWKSGVGRYIRVVANKWYLYEGNIMRGLLSGKGKELTEDGFEYHGEFQFGKFHGEGKLQRTDGTVYEGEWQKGRQHGKGKQTETNGDYCVGEWKQVSELQKTKKIGVHSYYDKEGVLLRTEDHGQE